MPGLSQQVVPYLYFFIFLHSEFVINSLCYLLRVNIVVSFDAILRFLSVLVLLHIVSHPSCFVEEESSLHLVLSLLVSWWSGLERDVPSMIVDISGITTCVSCLRVGNSYLLVFQPFTNHEPVMRLMFVVSIIL